MTFLLSLLLLIPTAVEAIPIKPAIPARGAPARAPIKVKEVARLADDNTTVNTPAEVANASAMVFARLYFLLIRRYFFHRNFFGEYSTLSKVGSRDGAVVEHLSPMQASHQCGPGSILGLGVICGLSLLLVLVLAPRGFSPGTPVFPSPQKPTFPNSNLLSLFFFKRSLGFPAFRPSKNVRSRSNKTFLFSGFSMTIGPFASSNLTSMPSSANISCSFFPMELRV